MSPRMTLLWMHVCSFMNRDTYSVLLTGEGTEQVLSQRSLDDQPDRFELVRSLCRRVRLHVCSHLMHSLTNPPSQRVVKVLVASVGTE